MPRGDGTGPIGMGQMTGRAAGYCAGYAIPGFMNPIPGRGYGRRGAGGFGRGMGRGRGGAWAYPAAPYAAPLPYDTDASPQDEVTMLKEQAKYFSTALEGINNRIAEIKTDKK